MSSPKSPQKIRIHATNISEADGQSWTDEITLHIFGETPSGKELQLILTVDTQGVVCAIRNIYPLMKRKVDYHRERLADLQRASQG